MQTIPAQRRANKSSPRGREVSDWEASSNRQAFRGWGNHDFQGRITRGMPVVVMSKSSDPSTGDRSDGDTDDRDGPGSTPERHHATVRGLDGWVPGVERHRLVAGVLLKQQRTDRAARHKAERRTDQEPTPGSVDSSDAYRHVLDVPCRDTQAVATLESHRERVAVDIQHRSNNLAISVAARVVTEGDTNASVWGGGGRLSPRALNEEEHARYERDGDPTRCRQRFLKQVSTRA